MWTALEDYILTSAINYIMTKQVVHLSLHYDGLRVQFANGLANVDELCKDIGLYVAKDTDFYIRIREKTHHTLFDLLRQRSTAKGTSSSGMPGILRREGHCILAALHKLRPLNEDTLADLHGTIGDVNHQTYEDAMSRAQIQVVDVSVGVTVEGGTDCLLHAENGGNPHCIAVRRVGPNITLWNGDVESTMQYSELIACYMEAVDKCSVVTFTLYDATNKNEDTGIDIWAATITGWCEWDHIASTKSTTSGDGQSIAEVVLYDLNSMVLTVSLYIQLWVLSHSMPTTNNDASTNSSILNT